MLGIPAGGLAVATVCKRIAAVVGELLFGRNWFEISGGAAAAVVVAKEPAAGFQKVSFFIYLYIYLSAESIISSFSSYKRDFYLAT